MSGNDSNATNTTSDLQSNISGFGVVFSTTIATLLIAVIILAICGNLLVCAAILAHQRLRKTTNYFIFSLAISDMLTACFSMSFDADSWLNQSQWSHGEFACNFWAVMYLTAAPTSILHLLAVSVDRYQAIKAPLRYCRVMRPRKALVIIAAIWLYSFLFAIIAMAGWPYFEQSVMGGFCYFNIQPYYSVVSSFVNFILPSLAICVVYYHVYKIAREHARRIGKVEMGTTSYSNEESTGIPSQKKVMKRNIKAAKTIAILVSALLFCWMPMTVYSILGIFCRDCFTESPQEVFPVLLVLAYINSALNPILYSFYNREFRESFKRLLKLQLNFR